jgi:hypothetical protein
MKERAETYLLLLAGMPGTRERGPLPRDEDESAHWASAFENAADALKAVGLVADAEVAPLRRKLAEGIEEWRSQALPPPDDRLARECEALPRAERDAWRERLREVDDGQTPSLERERRRLRFNKRELVGVVRGDAAAGSGIAFAIAELYAAGTVLRWHRAAPEVVDTPIAAARQRPADPPLSLTDDLATEYLHCYTLGHPGSWTASFATAAPVAATGLIAEIEGERVSFALPERGG